MITAELEDPSILNSERIKRISQGSGQPLELVDSIIQTIIHLHNSSTPLSTRFLTKKILIIFDNTNIYKTRSKCSPKKDIMNWNPHVMR